MYYRNAQAALVVYDLTKPSSLTKAKHWVAELQRQASPGIVIALVGNKLDLADEDSGEAETESEPTNGAAGDESGAQDGGEDHDGEPDEEDAPAAGARKISKKEASSYAEEEGLLFFETSAKSGLNVPEVFTAIANAIPESSLKGSRGTASAGHSLGASGRAGEGTRVDLRERGAAAPKEGCAC